MEERDRKGEKRKAKREGDRREGGGSHRKREREIDFSQMASTTLPPL